MSTNLASNTSRAAQNASDHGLRVIPSLNGIRAVSVMIVVFAHAGFENVVPGGLGVTIFFFLSGYLITTLLLSEYEQNGVIDIWNFYARRLLRIAPPLIIMLIIAYGLVYSSILPPISFNIYTLLSQIFYLANYAYIFSNVNESAPLGTGILWSLAVEEHFYIFYPFLLLFALKLTDWPPKLFATLAAICAGVLFWRIYLVAGGASEYRTYYASDTRIDSIAYGCLLAIWFRIAAIKIYDSEHARSMSISQWFVFILSICGILFTIIYRNNFFRETFRYSIQGFCLCFIFYYAIIFHTNFLFSNLNSKLIIKIGIYSYFTYLIHSVIINALVTSSITIFHNPFVMLPIALILSISYSFVIDKYIDPYFRHLRELCRPRGSLRAVVPAS